MKHLGTTPLSRGGGFSEIAEMITGIYEFSALINEEFLSLKNSRKMELQITSECLKGVLQSAKIDNTNRTPFSFVYYLNKL